MSYFLLKLNKFLKIMARTNPNVRYRYRTFGIGRLVDNYIAQTLSILGITETLWSAIEPITLSCSPHLVPKSERIKKFREIYFPILKSEFCRESANQGMVIK